MHLYIGGKYIRKKEKTRFCTMAEKDTNICIENKYFTPKTALIKH